MGRLRPRTRLRSRKCIHRHAHRRPTREQQFWTDYAGTRTAEDVFDTNETIRFWVSYASQNPPSGTNSPPREHTTPERTETRKGLKRPSVFLRQIQKSMERTMYGGIAKMNTCISVLGFSPRVFQFCQAHHRITGAAALILNFLIASHQASIPSKPLTKYHQFPTWMHTDPIQVIGLPAMVSPLFVPNQFEISRAHRKFQAAWSLDHLSRNDFSTIQENLIAYIRGEDARTTLDTWFENPYCPARVELFEARHQPGFTYNDSLPSFANPCRCTYPFFIKKQLELALIPFFLQSPVPQTEAALSSYCPCNRADAEASWATFSKDKQPPLLLRIARQFSLASVLLDYRVMEYVRSGNAFPDLLPIRESKIDLCIEGKLPECPNMRGWAVWGDFHLDGRECLNQLQLRSYWRAKNWNDKTGIHHET